MHEQNGRGPVEYEDLGNNVAVAPSITGIAYTEVGPLCPGGAVKNGTYSGLSEVEGNSGAANLGVES